jgi:tetratricopeptide (TPR) repeat protein
VVAVVAEPGTGKSRLFYEFKATLPETCKVLEAHSVSHGKTSAWLPVLELLRGYFDIQDSDDPSMRRDKVRAALRALDPALDDASPYLFGLLGIVQDPDPLAHMELQIKRQRTFDALKRTVLRESLRQPIVVIFEDLHWIDDQTEALLNLLTDSLASARILLLVNYRPEYHHGWTNKSYYLQLRLDPLGGADGAAMLVALLGESVELNPVKRLIAERTGGNPFFIEEIVQTLFDEGALVRNGAVKVTRSLSQLKLPLTVQGMLAARIDRLLSSQKDLLQTLAVLGRESSLGLLNQVASYSNTQLGLTLAQLLASEFIYEQPVAGDVEYVFKHALTQEVAYNSLLIDRRKVLHERAGQALESMFAGQLDDHLDDLAHHYSRSDKVAKAAHYLGLAGIRALDSSAHTEAKALLSASLERLRTLPESPDRDRTELTAQISLGELTMALKGYADPEVERAYGRATELCGRLPDTPFLLRARALSGLSANYQFRSRYRECLEIGKQLLALSRDTDSLSGLATAYLCFATASFWLGDLKVAREYLEKIVAMSRIRRTAVHIRVGIPSVSLRFLAWTLWYTGYPDQGLKAARRALRVAKERNHAFSLAGALSQVARFHVMRREPTIALELANEGLEYSERNSFPTWNSESNIVRGWSLAQLGREEEGIAAMPAGLAIRDAAQENDARPQYQAWLAEALGRVGRVREGLDLIASYLDTEHELPVYEPEVHLLRASLYLEQDPPDLLQAKRSTQAAIEIAQGFGAKSFELRATTRFARLLASQGNRDEARTMLAEIYNWFTEGFDTADLKDAKALLQDLAP